MYKDWRKLAIALAAQMKTTNREMPELWRSFSEMARHATDPGSLDRKTKELIAVAMAVGQQSEGSIAFHARAAVKAGAKREEFTEALQVAVFMGGSTASVYAAMALEAYDQFYDDEMGYE